MGFCYERPRRVEGAHVTKGSQSFPRPGLEQAAPVWVKIGLLSFGGPAAQIALMQDEVVTRRGWVPGDSFDRGLAFAMMLPGPEAQQLATWLGWRLHGVAGGLLAGMAFVLPGAVLMIALAWVAAALGSPPLSPSFSSTCPSRLSSRPRRWSASRCRCRPEARCRPGLRFGVVPCWSCC